MRIVIGGVPEGSRRDYNIVRVSSFTSKELNCHERSCIVPAVLWCGQALRLKLALLREDNPPSIYFSGPVQDHALDPTRDCISGPAGDFYLKSR